MLRRSVAFLFHAYIGIFKASEKLQLNVSCSTVDLRYTLKFVSVIFKVFVNYLRKYLEVFWKDLDHTQKK